MRVAWGIPVASVRVPWCGHACNPKASDCDTRVPSCYIPATLGSVLWLPFVSPRIIRVPLYGCHAASQFHTQLITRQQSGNARDPTLVIKNSGNPFSLGKHR